MRLALIISVIGAAIGFLTLAVVFACGVGAIQTTPPCSYVASSGGGFPDGLRNAAIILIAMIATFNWAIGQFLSQLRARQQHTISLIVMRLTNDELVKDIDHIDTALPRGSVLSERDAALFSLGDYDKLAPETLKLLQAIKRIANFYEFLAEAYMRRTVDREVLKSTLGGSFGEFYQRVWPYILSAQRRFDKETLRVAPEKKPENDAFARYEQVLSDWRVAPESLRGAGRAN